MSTNLFAGSQASKDRGYSLAAGFAGVALLISGCATQPGTRPGSSDTTHLDGPQASPFGRVALGGDSTPATYSFQKAKGKLGSAKEAISDSAKLALSGPAAGALVSGAVLNSAQSDSDVVLIAAVAGSAVAVGAGVVAPVVGTVGLVRSLQSVSPAELAQREKVLTNAMCQVAAQQRLRAFILETAAKQVRGGLLSTESARLGQKTGVAADAVLEVRVEDLRLERAGSSEGSYFLRIRTHGRITRTAEVTPCYDRRVEWRSGTALFLDWTLQGAVECVAETGYQALAQYYVEQLLPRAAGSEG